MADRIPPQNVEAEQSVLGAMLIDQEAVNRVLEVLQPDDFYRQDNRVIYLAMANLNKNNQPVDLVTVAEELQHMEKLEAVGGSSTLTALSNAVPTSANVLYHAGIVKDKALRRQLISTATEIVASGYEEGNDIDQTLDSAEKDILQVAKGRQASEFATMKEVVNLAMDRIDKMYNEGGLKMTGLPSGFVDFDRMTAGLQPSDLIIIAARPSMGKSTIVLNMAQYLALKKQKKVAVFSLEMSKEQLVQRMICAEAGVDASKLRLGQLTEKEWNDVVTAVDRLSRADIFLDDTPGISGMEMRAKARRLKNSSGGGLDLIIVDYLQLMQGNSSKRSSENRQQELSDISRSLKALGRELNVPVIALSQLSRSVEQRPNKRPMLSDLRESGALEQDADIVAFLYRDAYYNPDTEEPNLTEFIIAKHRNGPTGTVKLFFQPQFTKFMSIDTSGRQ
ncbi:MAG: replicative DNA helicase [Acidaminococcaceae bacterium]|nr:replicative DNA helicase [Acidaminococcaceae bacterium]